MNDSAIQQMLAWIDEADAVVVGGAAGMSAAGGDGFYDLNPTFLRYFGDLFERLGRPREAEGIFNLFYYQGKTRGQDWYLSACFAQMVCESGIPRQYWDLKELLRDKDHFVVTTNQDQLFRRVFGDQKTAFIQGDAGWYQCGRRCTDALYDAWPFAQNMLGQAHDCEVPREAFPRCPHCGAEMELWMRGPTFLEGAMYREQYRKYNGFLRDHLNKRVLFLELGVGAMTPMFIKEPFWNYTYQWPGGARYIPITLKHAHVPREIADRSLPLDAPIDQVLRRAVELRRASCSCEEPVFDHTEYAIAHADMVGVGI